jgi:hypothetical protein
MYIVADTASGFAFCRDREGIFTRKSASDFADIMNDHEGQGKYRVFLLCVPPVLAELEERVFSNIEFHG